MGNLESVEEQPLAPSADSSHSGDQEGPAKQWKSADVASVTDSVSTVDTSADGGGRPPGADTGTLSSAGSAGPTALEVAAADVAAAAAPVAARMTKHLEDFAEMIRGDSAEAVSATSEIRNNLSSYLSLSAVRDIFISVENDDSSQAAQEPHESDGEGSQVFESYLSMGFDGIKRLFSGSIFVDDVNTEEQEYNEDEENMRSKHDSDSLEAHGTVSTEGAYSKHLTIKRCGAEIDHVAALGSDPDKNETQHTYQNMAEVATTEACTAVPERPHADKAEKVIYETGVDGAHSVAETLPESTGENLYETCTTDVRVDEGMSAVEGTVVGNPTVYPDARQASATSGDSECHKLSRASTTASSKPTIQKAGNDPSHPQRAHTVRIARPGGGTSNSHSGRLPKPAPPQHANK